jgi:prepilin-type N-terminal cleavage/methylation domain-containing protein
MGGYKSERGFSLLETLVSLALVAVAMTGLIVAFVGSGKFGVLARRQANAVALARSIANDLENAPWNDPRLQNTNTANDGSFADGAGRFAWPTVPTGANAPDSSLGTKTVGNENSDVYVNVAADGNQGLLFAVIVRYTVGKTVTGAATYMRAVVLGYRYNPAAIGVGQLPI